MRIDRPTHSVSPFSPEATQPVLRRRIREAAAALCILLAAAPLAGCGSFLTEGTADAAGVAGAGIAGSVSKNAAVGAGIGLGVAAAANSGLLLVERNVHHHQQDVIAAIAGPLPEGQVAAYSVTHTIPIERDVHGELAVARTIDGPDFACKEIIFSVDNGPPEKLRRQFFTAFICLDGDKWHWATAEPATARWGALQ